MKNLESKNSLVLVPSTKKLAVRWSFTPVKAVRIRPGFWTAFAMTLTETVGAGILALPISLARIGPVAGVIILVLVGLINLLTLTFMTQAVLHSKTIHQGNSFLGLVVFEYLGRTGSVILSIGIAFLCFIALVIYYLGFGTTLAAATGLPAPLLVALLFVFGVFLLKRKALHLTTKVAMLVGGFNLLLIVVLMLLAFFHLQVAYLSRVNLPLLNNAFNLNVTDLGLVFGVVTGAYFGHLSTSNCAVVVLRRDPTGRSLVLGNITAMLVAMFLYSLWVVAIGGAIAPQRLAGEVSTTLVPLAQVVGPEVFPLSITFICLSMGMGTIHFSLSLFNLVKERLPQAVSSDPATQAQATGLQRLWSSYILRDRFLVCLSPVIVAFGLTELSLFTNFGSFTGLFGFSGLLLSPLFTGIYPIWLIGAVRSRPEFQSRLKFLSHSLVLVVLFVVLVGIVLVHGLFIWEAPLARLAALAEVSMIIFLSIWFWSKKVFKPVSLAVQIKPMIKIKRKK